jgi:hypothetical protein
LPAGRYAEADDDDDDAFEAELLAEAHDDGLHDEHLRDDCPVCRERLEAEPDDLGDARIGEPIDLTEPR